MKKLYVLLLAVCLVHPVLAQKFRMVDTANRWVVFDQWGFIGEQHLQTSILQLVGDTVYNGMHYQRMKAVLASDSATPTRCLCFGDLFREDTVNNRVYCVNLFAGDTIERVIFDYNWKIDDSVEWNNEFCNCIGYSVIKGIDSTQINGNWHRVFNMESRYELGSPVPFAVIEGIGSTKGPGFGSSPFMFENDSRLKCFFQAGTKPILNPSVYGFDNAGTCYLSVPTTQAITGTVQIVPNPGGQDAELRLPSASFQQCIIWDVCGRKLVTLNLAGKMRASIGSFIETPGLYLLEVTDIEGRRLTRKFVFQK